MDVVLPSCVKHKTTKKKCRRQGKQGASAVMENMIMSWDVNDLFPGLSKEVIEIFKISKSENRNIPQQKRPNMIVRFPVLCSDAHTSDPLYGQAWVLKSHEISLFCHEKVRGTQGGAQTLRKTQAEKICKSI